MDNPLNDKGSATEELTEKGHWANIKMRTRKYGSSKLFKGKKANEDRSDSGKLGVPPDPETD